jgi:DNA-binding beta-propeller fold protein YncE
VQFGPILASMLLGGAFALPSFSTDWLFVSTNWNEQGHEQVLVVNPESSQTRVLWNSGTEVDVVVSPDAKRLYVTYIGNKGYELAIIDTSTGAILHRRETPQLIRWIFPSRPGMATSSDGRWLYLLKTNYSVGSSEYSLLTFDTLDTRFVSEERSISNCSGPRPLPVPGGGKVRVLCGGEAASEADAGLVLRLQSVQNFVFGRGGDGDTLYTARLDGRVQAVGVAADEIKKTSTDAPLRHRRIMPSSETISPDGRLWYVPIKIPDNGEREIEQILVFDTQTMGMTNIITPAGPFWGLALSSDGRWLYASQPDLKSILIIDTETRQTVRKLAIAGKPSIVLAAKAP